MEGGRRETHSVEVNGTSYDVQCAPVVDTLGKNLAVVTVLRPAGTGDTP